MGNGIAHVFARAGYKVILRDVEQRFLDRGLETIAKNLDREVKKGKLAESEKPVVLARLQPTTEMSAVARADFAVEAVPERLDLKLAVLREADSVLRPGVILATNTSSISITSLAAATKLRRELEDALRVDHVARQPHDVGVGVEVDRLDVLVAEHDLVLPGRQPGDRRQRQVREDTLLLEARQDAVEGPERLRVLRRDQIDLHPLPLPTGTV